MFISRFLAALATATIPPHCCNPYSGKHAANTIRRSNLNRYLQQMQQIQPTTLLVGEAPGYRGCRLTGVPFTSPTILCAGVKAHQLLGQENGYQRPAEWPHIQREASATIVWEAIAALPAPPLLWNAFPFHPHQPGDPQSNRSPKISDLDRGRPFLTILLENFPITTIIAIGNKADCALTRWQLPHHKIRHPSHGGKQAFTTGVFKLVK